MQKNDQQKLAQRRQAARELLAIAKGLLEGDVNYIDFQFSEPDGSSYQSELREAPYASDDE